MPSTLHPYILISLYPYILMAYAIKIVERNETNICAYFFLFLCNELSSTSFRAGYLLHHVNIAL